MFGLQRAENLGRWVIHMVLEIIHWSSNHYMIYEFGKELIRKSCRFSFENKSNFGFKIILIRFEKKIHFYLIIITRPAACSVISGVKNY